ncbi:hypothetical protein LNKW23_08820 [Paralimibaculum aggregatum]|uniref:Histidine phosphatase family protein n=1 Tax=Paralimibaculum aggregatum TaxID=3036245 RepID=A0ABQ6LHR0_9RHOB|nr:hypothetical protein [Limibaculum sp. NKW23]GMG81669.1 hypothetical protein LNKW23_08820 [Limibaculum sp. NKW23]
MKRALRPTGAALAAALAAGCIAALMLAAAPRAGAYDYRVLHMIEDRHTHVVLRISEPPAGGDLPQRGRAACADVPALDRRGRNRALAFGRMFQNSGIHVDLILTSRLCRNIQAAALMKIGPLTEQPLLDAPESGEIGEEQTEALLGYLDGLRASETALLVAHGAVIEALTGERLEPGEGLVFTLPPFGEMTLRGRFDLPPH